MANEKTRKISAGHAPRHSTSITTPQPSPRTLAFSFRHLSMDGRFSCADVGSPYWVKLTERLKALSDMTAKELRAANNKSLRCHPIAWEETTEQDGWTHLNDQLQQQQPFQFSISANENGRVHGFFIDDVFYVVWLDPSHALYSGQ